MKTILGIASGIRPGILCAISTSGFVIAILAIVLLSLLVLLGFMIYFAVQDNDKNQGPENQELNPDSMTRVPLKSIENDGCGISETTVLADETFYDVPSIASGILICRKNNRQESINKSVYKIGKDALHCDLCVSDNSAVSRMHAIIKIQNDGAYIEDCNSTNGTYIDEKRLIPGCPVKLTDGAIIKLADEEFEYRI